MVDWGGQLYEFFKVQNMYKLKVVKSLTMKVDVTKFPYLIITYLQESCMRFETHNDAKELVGGLHEVVIFAS
jgi:hypothetical protein